MYISKVKSNHYQTSNRSSFIDIANSLHLRLLELCPPPSISPSTPRMPAEGPWLPGPIEHGPEVNPYHWGLYSIWKYKIEISGLAREQVAAGYVGRLGTGSRDAWSLTYGLPSCWRGVCQETSGVLV